MATYLDQGERERRARALAYSERHIRHCCCGGAGWVRVDAQPGHELFGQAIPCVCQVDDRARQRAQRLRATSGISDNEMLQWQFATFDPARCRSLNGDAGRIVEAMAGARRRCEAYARDPEGWLILSGAPGSGKTHLAYAIAGDCLRREVPVYAHAVPDLLQDMRAAYAEDGAFDQLLTDLQTIDLLVLDDLGAERATAWGLEALYQIVNHRYAKRRPMVVTTNADLADDHCGIDERLLSRLREGTQAERGWVRLLSLPAADFRPWRHGR